MRISTNPILRLSATLAVTLLICVPALADGVLVFGGTGRLGAETVKALIATNETAETTLRVGVSALPLAQGNPFETFRMPTITTMAAIFDGFTRLDRDGNAQPALATDWPNIDPPTGVFTLRQGTTFSNGAPLTAEAIVNTVRLHGSMNPDFFKGTVVEAEATEILAQHSSDKATAEQASLS